MSTKERLKEAWGHAKRVINNAGNSNYRNNKIGSKASKQAMLPTPVKTAEPKDREEKRDLATSLSNPLELDQEMLSKHRNLVKQPQS